MCGIGAIYNTRSTKVPNIKEQINEINIIQKHRGQDESGVFISENESCGLCNNRLKIVDFDGGKQPMKIGSRIIVFNGEIYNYKELKTEIETQFIVKTNSDTEILLLLYILHGFSCLQKINGIFSFIIYDTQDHSLFVARDRFGIKPLYYTIKDNNYYFASECKSIVSYTDRKINQEALKDYLTFQYVLKEKTLFKDIINFPVGSYMFIENESVTIKKYTNTTYNADYNHTEKYFIENLRYVLNKSIKIQSETDLNVGAYCSGGIDSSIISILASQNKKITGFHGRFLDGIQYDESEYAKELTKFGIDLNIIDIKPDDFVNNIENIIYHMDYPEAGIGVFPQYMVAKNVPDSIRVLMGGQGGDELFGGYIRYLLAYFEQCIKHSIIGDNNNNKFIITYESIISNLCQFKNYTPMIKDFFSNGLFMERDYRYFCLIDRMRNCSDIINLDFCKDYNVYSEYQSIYNNENTKASCYFDEMTFYDINTSLRALLHVEDRVNMAHGKECRVPFLDNDFFDFTTTIPASIKFFQGNTKRILKEAYKDLLPQKILQRTDKMGFPVPLNKWIKENKNVKDFIFDTLNTEKARSRFYLKENAINKIIDNNNSDHSRHIWGLLCLELFQRLFID